ncbi:MAG: trypsin-like peptidase domain-containing protein [Polyangiaceae bacterium]
MQKQVVAVVLSTLVLVALGVGGCATEAREEALGKLGQESARIIGGDDDATRDAVVLLRASFQGGVKECSGTIVKVDAAAQVGYVLTAAHCVSWKPTTVLLGANPDDATTRQYRVLDMTSAAYSGTPGDTLHDVAVVRFLGASASTPVIPIAGASDGVDVGSAVTSVGYGITTLTPPDSGPSESPRRRHVARTLSAASTIDVNTHRRTATACARATAAAPCCSVHRARRRSSPSTRLSSRTARARPPACASRGSSRTWRARSERRSCR